VRALRTIVDPAAEFVLAAERVFGRRPRVLDGSRALLVDEVKLALEAGEKELWVIETVGPPGAPRALEHRLGMVPVRGDIESALRAAKEVLDDRN
jgi:hypothetical protein